MTRPRSASRARRRAELLLDDLGDLLARERVELDDLVDPVQELRPEEARADASALRMFDVMISTVLRKSTVRP